VSGAGTAAGAMHTIPKGTAPPPKHTESLPLLQGEDFLSYMVYIFASFGSPPFLVESWNVLCFSGRGKETQ